MDSYGLLTSEAARDAINDLDIKLSFAIAIRELQERLKMDYQHEIRLSGS